MARQWIFTRSRAEGIEAQVMTYGARVVSIKTADRDGKVANVVLGYSGLDGYLEDKTTYFGAIVGRYGNRIALASFRSMAISTRCR